MTFDILVVAICLIIFWPSKSTSKRWHQKYRHKQVFFAEWKAEGEKVDKANQFIELQALTFETAKAEAESKLANQLLINPNYKIYIEG